jgi:cardiolipin synthase A/B
MTMMVLNRSSKLVLSTLTFLLATLAYGASLPAPGLYENSRGSPLIPLINAAKKSIDIEIYSMENPGVHQAILAAQASGVKIRIVQEPTPVGDPCRIFSGSQTDDSATDAKDCTPLFEFYRRVRAGGGIYVPFRKELCGPATAGCVEHGKMVIVDAKAALLSTGNFNSTSLCDKRTNPAKCNRDYSYIIAYAPAIQVLGTIFEKDLAGVPYDLRPILARPGAADLSVSPYSLGPIVNFLRSAKRSIAIQQQYLKDPTMNAEILAAAKRGVNVYLMVASACAFGKPAPGPSEKWKQTYQTFEAAGVKIRAFTSSMKVGGLPGYLHAKTILIDGKTAWVGSVNGSTQAIASNREFGVFFDAPRDIAFLKNIMADDFSNPASESWQESLECRKDLEVAFPALAVGSF